MRRASIGLLAVVFLAFHLPYLPRSLEDLDSINFALGVRTFDVARHQPHPPGYPVFIAIGKAAHALVSDEPRALGLVSVVAGALGVVAIGALFRRVARDRADTQWTVAATSVAMTSPLYWVTAARPLSDMTGLAAAVAVQAMTLGAVTSRGLALAALAAGVASGIRSQVAWLTLPLVIARALGAWGWGLADRQTGDRSVLPDAAVARQSPSATPPVVLATAAFALGAALWFVPLVAITGGPSAYWRALSNQGVEDFGNISMLWTTHNARALIDALYFRAVAPWATLPAAAVVLALAAIGVFTLARRNRTAGAALAAAFGPYVVFDLLFQETFTGRYALPLVVPVAYLAAAALQVLPSRGGLAIALVVSMFDAHVAGTSVAAYAHEKAPAFRLLDDMTAAGRAAGQPPPVLAMDRRNWFDFRRPLAWIDGAIGGLRRMPAPPQHEWLEAVNYWNRGGQDPLWFVVDPKRAAIDLVQHGDPVRYRWPLPYPDLVSGTRPNEMDWYRVEQPDWYVGEGWSLTPEAAGVAAADRRGLAFGPIRGWMAASARSIVIGGRNFEPHAVDLTMTLAAGNSVGATARGDIWQDAWRVAPGPFLHFFHSVPVSHGPRDYLSVAIAATAPQRVAIEQFDASASRPVAGFGAGWHEQELDPRTGRRWRWLSERGELVIERPLAVAPIEPPARPMLLHVEGESPRKYYSRGSRLTARTGSRVVFDRVLDDDFSVDVPIDIRSGGVPESVVLETDQTYVPAERSRRTQDRRRLGLRIFTCVVRQAASAPDTTASSRPAR